jgi:hypothetical protein
MMKRVIAVMACGASLSACGSFNTSSFDMSSAFKSTPATADVRVESDPAGAEAKGPTGPGCRTPCTLQLPVTGATTVTFSLQGYLPTTAPVTITTASEAGDLGDSGVAETIRIDPDPVFAQLQVAPPPPPPPRKKATAKPKPRKPAAAPQAQQAPAPAPPPQQPGFGPPQQPPPSVFR